MAEERFSYREVKDGRVQISCEGKIVKILTGKDAVRFLARIDSTDDRGAQLLMAKATGQFKFGNERMGKEKGKGQ